MVTINEGSQPKKYGKQIVEIYCLSTDSKPTTGIANGSWLIEINTGDVYIFNEAGTAWVKQCSLQE